MTVGEIKSVLTLDATKFSEAAQRAVNDLSKFDGRLKTAKESLEGFEKGVTNVGTDLTSASEKFRALEQTVASLTARLEQTANSGFSGLSSQSRRAKSDIEGITSSVTGATDSMAEMTGWIKRYGGSLESLNPLISGVVKSQKTLAESNTALATSATTSLDKTTKAKITALEREKQTNAEMITSRKAMIAELEVIDRRMGAGQALAQKEASRFFGKNANSPNAVNAKQEVAIYKAQSDEAQATIGHLQAVVKEIEWKNQEIGKSIQLINAETAAIKAQEAATKTLASQQQSALRQQRLDAVAVAKEQRRADQESIASANEAARVRKLAAADAARAERESAQQIAQMWKGMAQMYAGSKIEKGIGASISMADQMQRQKVMVGALNLPKDQEDGLLASSEAMAKNLKFINTLDAVKSRMSAIASLGYNNADIIDKTLNSAVKAANNLEYLGVAHGDTQSTIRNLYGVVEMRQQTGNADKANGTMETIQKIITGTAGKVQTQDIETVLRRMGVGASQLSDTGLINVAGIIDQFKVAGGEGGSGSGVSTVGTMIKMFQSYALGKSLSGEAVKEFSGAGVLSESGLDFSKDKAGVLKDAKHAGFKNADKWLNDPVAAMRDIMPQVIAYTQKSGNVKKFYEGRDVNSVDAQMIAFTKYLTSLGITTTAAQGAMVMGDPRSQERLQHQTATISGSKGINEVNAAAMETMGQQWTKIKKTVDDIALNVGNSLVPVISEALVVVQSLATAFTWITEKNPTATAFAAIGASVGGVALIVNGTLKMFGSSFGAITAWIGEAVAGVGTFGAGILELGTFVGWLAKRFLGLAGAFLAGWDFGTWIANIDLGGLKVYEHLENLATNVLHKFKSVFYDVQEMWNNFLGKILGGDYANKTKDAAELTAKRAANDQYKRDMTLAAPVTTFEQLRAGEKDRTSVPIPAPVKATSTGGRVIDSPDRKHRAPHNFEDAFARQFSSADARSNIEKLKLDSLMSGDASFAEQAHQQVIKMWMGGDLDDGKDPSKRKFVKGGEKYDKKKGWSPEQMDWNAKTSIGGGEERTLTDLEKITAKRLEEEAVIKAVSFAKERSNSLDNEASNAVDELTGKTAGQTDAMKALIREFERLEGRTPGIKNNADYVSEKAKALTAKATIDYAGEGVILKQKNKEISASLLPTERERLVASQDALFDSESKKAIIVREALNKRIAELAASKGVESSEYKHAIAAREAGETEFTLFLENLQKRREEALLSPIQKMAKEWQDIHKQMGSDETQWAGSFITTLETTLDTGKLNVGAWAASVLKDIRKIYIQDTLATPLANGMKKIGDTAMNTLFNKDADGKSMGPVTGDTMWAGLKSAVSGVTDGVKSFWNSLTGATDATGKMIAQGANELMGTGLKMTAEQSATASLLALATAASAASVSMGGSAGGLLGGLFGGGGNIAAGAQSSGAFTSGVSMPSAVGVDLLPLANGGLITQFGPASLRKYAAGGIARSPQVSLFGEAGPEAYVPLPDGRSIPVTMTGAQGSTSKGGDTVTIQINVTSSGDSGGKKTGDDSSGAWSKLADRVKAVVRDELIVNQRPGGLLYK